MTSDSLTAYVVGGEASIAYIVGYAPASTALTAYAVGYRIFISRSTADKTGCGR